MAIPMTAQDKKWRAQDDARTLAVSEEIKNDKACLKLATDAAAKMAEDDRKRAIAMQKVAGKKTTPLEKKKPANRKSRKPSGSGPKKSTSNHKTFQRI